MKDIEILAELQGLKDERIELSAAVRAITARLKITTPDNRPALQQQHNYLTIQLKNNWKTNEIINRRLLNSASQNKTRRNIP